MLLRVSWLGALVITGFGGPWWLFIGLLVSYCLRYAASEAILVAVLVDAAYGIGATVVPYYTLATIMLTVIATWLHPRLWWLPESL